MTFANQNLLNNKKKTYRVIRKIKKKLDYLVLFVDILLVFGKKPCRCTLEAKL